ncbi:hypothetical protein X798_07476, partial [Onchocerca flexuosa]
AWLKSAEHEIVNRIDRRLELATNLEVETAEDLQIKTSIENVHTINNLSLEIFLEMNQRFEKLGTGNRIATFLIYMTRPEIGGRTVFMSNLKISVPCTKVSYSTLDPTQ